VLSSLHSTVETCESSVIAINPSMPASLILVDSSVWIDYYHPRGASKLKHFVKTALQQGTVATMGLIAVEVLQGASVPLVFANLQEDFLGLHWLELTQSTWLEAAQLAVRLRQSGLSIPTTDVIIAATALHYECRLWHHDRDFALLARQIPTLHETTLT